MYRIRRATAADAGVLARHRAEMFRDMGELPDGLYDALVEAARAYVTQAITDGRYVGWVAERDAESAEIVGGSRSWTPSREKSSAARDFSCGSSCPDPTPAASGWCAGRKGWW